MLLLAFLLLFIIEIYLLCYMELREGDVAKNQNIRSSRGAAEYSLTFEMVFSGPIVKVCLK